MRQELSLQVKRGEPFTVTLPSNANTGYAWRVIRAAMGKPTRRKYVPDEPVRLGSGGREEFTWAGVDGRGPFDIELVYERSDGHVAKVCAVSVTTH